jgi:hypothetical protein
MIRRLTTPISNVNYRSYANEQMREKLARIKNRPFDKVDRGDWLQLDSLKNNEKKRYTYAATILSKPHFSPLSSSKAYPRYTRNDHLLVKGLPITLQPQTIEQGFHIQMKIIQALTDSGITSPYNNQPFRVRGWKVGASQPQVQSNLKIDQPFLGVIFDHQYHLSSYLC